MMTAATETKIIRANMTPNGATPDAQPAQPEVQLLAPRSIFSMSDGQFQRMLLVAKMYSQSSLKYDGEKTEQDIFLTMLKGVELGLEPMAAIATIHLIKGMPTLSPQGMLALIHRSGQLENISIQGDAKKCTVTMKRVGNDAHTETFTFEDATNQQLVSRNSWRQMPAVMLKWRAVAACARVVFPDIIQGLYTQEEIGADVAYSDSGDIISITPPSLPEPEAPPHWAGDPDKVKVLEDLMGIKIAEACKLLGIDNPTDYDGTGKEFGVEVEKALAKQEADTPPAEPKSKPDFAKTVANNQEPPADEPEQKELISTPPKKSSKAKNQFGGE